MAEPKTNSPNTSAASPSSPARSRELGLVTRHPEGPEDPSSMSVERNVSRRRLDSLAVATA